MCEKFCLKRLERKDYSNAMEWGDGGWVRRFVVACCVVIGLARSCGAAPTLKVEPQEPAVGAELTVRAEGFPAGAELRWRWTELLRAERLRGDRVVLKALGEGEGAVFARSGSSEAEIRFVIRGKGGATAAATRPTAPPEPPRPMDVAKPMEPPKPPGSTGPEPHKVAGGAVVERHANGAKAAEGGMKDGEREGVWVFWNEDGKKVGEGEYRAGQKQGAWKEWDDRGNLVHEGVFEDGREIRYAETEWDDKGRKTKEETVTRVGDAKAEEVVEWGWHDNGKMMGEKRTLNGVRHGEWKLWDEAGKLMMSVVFTNGWALPPEGELREPTAKRAAEAYMGVIGLGTNDFARAAAVAGSLSPEEQEALAGVVFKALMAMDEYDTAKFERLYRLVIDACPATDRAHEAHWRLTHMYQRAYDEPQNEKIVALLEGFLARYRESKVVSMEKYPDEMLVFSPLRSLHQSYEAMRRWDKIAAHYQKAVAEKTPLKPQDHFDYAKALDELGKKADAIEWYEKFLKVEPDKDSFTVELARDRVKEMKGQ